MDITENYTEVKYKNIQLYTTMYITLRNIILCKKNKLVLVRPYRKCYFYKAQKNKTIRYMKRISKQPMKVAEPLCKSV